MPYREHYGVRSFPLVRSGGGGSKHGIIEMRIYNIYTHTPRLAPCAPKGIRQRNGDGSAQNLKYEAHILACFSSGVCLFGYGETSPAATLNAFVSLFCSQERRRGDGGGGWLLKILSLIDKNWFVLPVTYRLSSGVVTTVGFLSTLAQPGTSQQCPRPYSPAYLVCK